MPINKYLINPIRELAETGKLTGILLIAATLFSLIISNTGAGNWYTGLWEIKAGIPFLHKSILHWINDGLMPLFFLLVGIEIKREFTKGELSEFRQAVLPVGAAIGGILVPAAFYFLLNTGNPDNLRGWAIPTATDIAFSLGVLSLLGNRVPFALKVFLVALAIIDDLGAIVIIAIFYTQELDILLLMLSLGVFLIMLILSRFRIKSFWLYLLGGGLLWLLILKSGVHPTIAGVLIALIMPRELAEEAEHRLNRPVSYLILPLFALANTAIPLSFSLAGELISTLSLGIIAGLFLGKPAGIAGFTYLLYKFRLGTLSPGLTWRHITGLGFIAGIGFTMSIFISSLSFTNESAGDLSKLAVMAGSLLAGLAGTLILRSCPHCPEKET